MLFWGVLGVFFGGGGSPNTSPFEYIHNNLVSSDIKDLLSII